MLNGCSFTFDAQCKSLHQESAQAHLDELEEVWTGVHAATSDSATILVYVTPKSIPSTATGTKPWNELLCHCARNILVRRNFL